MHMSPAKIEIDGTMMQGMLQGKMEFGLSTIDALVRLYQHMDNVMYTIWEEKRWRHFLPTDFAVRNLIISTFTQGKN